MTAMSSSMASRCGGKPCGTPPAVSITRTWRGRAIAQERPVGERVLLCRWGYADDGLHVAAVPFLRCGGPCCYEYKRRFISGGLSSVLGELKRRA